MFDFPAHYIAHREEAPDGGPGPGDPEAGWQALYEIGDASPAWQAKPQPPAPAPLSPWAP